MESSSINVLKTIDNLPALKRKIELATLVSRVSVEVGVFDDEPRAEGEISNSKLAMIHEKGAPDANIPKREFMAPAIEDSRVQIYKMLSVASRKHFKNRAMASKEQLVAAGELIAEKMRENIRRGLKPALSPETLVKGIRKGRKNFNPLMDTLQLLNSIKHKLTER